MCEVLIGDRPIADRCSNDWSCIADRPSTTVVPAIITGVCKRIFVFPRVVPPVNLSQFTVV